MPPKKKSSAGTKRSADSDAQAQRQTKAPRKRGQKTQQESEAPVKLDATSKSELIKWLLSDEAFHLAYPPIPAGKGETDLPKSKMGREPPKNLDPSNGDEAKASREAEVASAQKDSNYQTYPSEDLTPFQLLLTSYFLSSPISHTLSLRTIGVIFNRPYTLRTPSAIEEAGEDGRREVLWTARTQHKEKTAVQLGEVVKGVRELCGEKEEDVVALKAVLNEAQKAAKEQSDPRKAAREALLDQLKPIKGIGPGACEIFFRNIQSHLPELYPYVDSRGLKYAGQVGLTPAQDGDDVDDMLSGADELRDVLEESLGKGKTDDEAQRRAFVRLINVLVGLGLEGQLDKAREQSAGEN